MHQVSDFPFLSPPQRPGELGRLSHYRVLEVLGEGGMGIVFKAQDLNLERSVALKVMRPHLAAKPVQKMRFEREAKATANIKNDYIVTIYEVNEERGLPFLAMELLQGMPMDAWLAKGKRPTIQQILRLGKQAALGLAAAHERGLIHRDVKPANLWIEATGGGRVKLLDFGLARAAEENVNLTQSGIIVGTPAYMSPEQARGLKVDPRSDLFSLGCVLYRLVTGQPPFQGETTMAVLTSLAVDEPRKVLEANPEVPAALADLIHRLLAKNPEERPASAKAVATALAALEKELANGPTQAIPVPAIPLAVATPVEADPTISISATPVRNKRRWLRWAGIGAAILLGLGILHSILNPRGTLDIQMDDKQVELTIRMGEQVLADRSTEREFELPTGKGQLEAFDPEKDSLFTIDFEIFRSQRTVLNLNDNLKQKRAAQKDPSSTLRKEKRPHSPLDQFERADLPMEVLSPVGGTRAAPVELVGIWRVPSTAPTRIAYVNTVLFSADGASMVTAGTNTPVLRWDLRKKSDNVARWTNVGDVQPSRVFLSADSLFLGYPGVMQIVSLKDGKSRNIRGEGVEAEFWTVSDDGQWLAGGNQWGSIWVWNTKTVDPHNRYTVPRPLRSLAFHPGRDWLLAQYWQPGQRRFLQFFDLRSNRDWEGPPKDDFKITAEPLPPPVFSPDGAFLMFGVQGRRDLQRYPILEEKGELLHRIGSPLGPFGPGLQFSLSRDGKHVAVTTHESKLHVRDFLSGRNVTVIDLHQVAPNTTSFPFFAPDGRHVAVAYHDVVYLYRVDPISE